MARPAKAVNTTTCNLTKEERESREILEQTLAGNADKLVPPSYLTPTQREVFEFIIANLEEAKILGNIDLMVLTRTAVVVGCLIELEKEINATPVSEIKAKTINNYDKMSKLFAKYCNELSLSPQSRAKLSIQITAQAQDKPKTIMDMMRDEE